MMYAEIIALMNPIRTVTGPFWTDYAVLEAVEASTNVTHPLTSFVQIVGKFQPLSYPNITLTNSYHYLNMTQFNCNAPHLISSFLQINGRTLLTHTNPFPYLICTILTLIMTLILT